MSELFFFSVGRGCISANQLRRRNSSIAAGSCESWSQRRCSSRQPVLANQEVAVGVCSCVCARVSVRSKCGGAEAGDQQEAEVGRRCWMSSRLAALVFSRRWLSAPISTRTLHSQSNEKRIHFLTRPAACVHACMRVCVGNEVSEEGGRLGAYLEIEEHCK